MSGRGKQAPCDRYHMGTEELQVVNMAKAWARRDSRYTMAAQEGGPAEEAALTALEAAEVRLLRAVRALRVAEGKLRGGPRGKGGAR